MAKKKFTLAFDIVQPNGACMTKVATTLDGGDQIFECDDLGDVIPMFLHALQYHCKSTKKKFDVGNNLEVSVGDKNTKVVLKNFKVNELKPKPKQTKKTKEVKKK